MATVQPLSFVPTSISGCSLWLDAADRSALVLSGSNVSQWNDKSGNGRNTSTTYGTPQYRTTGFNNQLPSLYFTSNSGFTGPITNTGTTVTAFVVGRLNTVGNPYRMLSLGEPGRYDFGTTTDIVICTTGNATTEFGWYRNVNFESNTGTAMITTVYNSPFLYTLNVNGATGTIVYNGSTTNSGTTSGSFGYSTYGVGVGFTTAPTLTNNFLSNGFIAEVLVYTSSFTLAQRQQVEGYLAWKWGLQASLPVTHPYYYIAPNSQGLGIPPGLRLTAPIQSFQTSSVGLPFLNPTSLSGIQLWLDGQDPNATGITPSNGASVSTWVDKSGVGNNGSAGGSTPTYTLATRGVTFSSGYYNTNYSASLTTETVFLVFISPTLTDFQRMMSSTGGGRELFLNAAGSLFAKSVATGDMVNTGSGTITGNTTILMTYQLTSAANPVIYTFGTLRGTGSYVTLSAGRTTAIGYLPGGGNNFVGTMFEVIGYNTSLSTYDRQQVEGYLAWKWGLVASLPSSHPFKTRSPVLVPFPSTRNFGQGAFSPVRVANCVLWLDASDRLTVVLSGSSVTGWNDKSGNGNNAYNTPGALLPTYSTTAFNSGYPGLVFTTTVDTPGYTPAPSNSTVMFFPNCQGASNDASYFAVYQPGDTTGRTVLNNYKNQYTLWYTLATTGVNSTVAPTPNPIGVSYTATTNPTFADFTMASGSTNTFTGGQNGSVSVVTQNVTPQGTGVDNNPLGAIGAYYESYTSGNPYFGSTYKGTISEVLIFVRALSTAERQSVEGYLAWKWGLVGNLPATHPYKKFPPPPN